MNEEKFNKMVLDVEIIKLKLEDLTKIQNEKVDHLFEKLEDDEKRIRVLEDFKSKMIGAILVSGFFGGIIGALIQFIAGKF